MVSFLKYKSDVWSVLQQSVLALCFLYMLIPESTEYQLLDDISKVFCVCIFRDSLPLLDSGISFYFLVSFFKYN